MIQNFDIYPGQRRWLVHIVEYRSFQQNKTKKLIDFKAPLCNTIWKSCLSISCAFVLRWKFTPFPDSKFSNDKNWQINSGEKQLSIGTW